MFCGQNVIKITYAGPPKTFRKSYKKQKNKMQNLQKHLYQ